MTDKKVPLDLSDMDAAPAPEEDGAGPDNALKDSDAQVDDKLQSQVEHNSDAHIDVGLQDNHQSPAEQVPDEDTKWMEGLAPEVTSRIQYLLELESRQDKLDEEIEEHQVEYEHALELLYTERSKIVNGEVDVKSNMVETAEEATSDEKATKGIPDFWLTVLKNNEVLAGKITRRDEEALKYLKDIICCTFDDQLEFKLDFYFDNNYFFKNSILTRTCEEIPLTGTKIDWLPGKRLTHVVPKKKSRQGLPQHNTRTKKCDSFFHFFGGVEDVMDFIGVDDDNNIRDILMYEIIPNAVSWYTGEASQEYSDETESAEEEDKPDEYEDENEGNGEASNKRTRVEGPTARKSR